MIFGYQVDKDIKLKILEEREAEQLFKLVDSNRNYLAEFLPFIEHTKRVEDSKHFIHSALQQFIDGNGFHCGIWSNKELIGVIGLYYLDLVNKTTSNGLINTSLNNLIRKSSFKNNLEGGFHNHFFLVHLSTLSLLLSIHSLVAFLGSSPFSIFNMIDSISLTDHLKLSSILYASGISSFNPFRAIVLMLSALPIVSLGSSKYFKS